MKRTTNLMTNLKRAHRYFVMMSPLLVGDEEGKLSLKNKFRYPFVYCRFMKDYIFEEMEEMTEEDKQEQMEQLKSLKEMLEI